jgi:hypothetical protein
MGMDRREITPIFTYVTVKCCGQILTVIAMNIQYTPDDDSVDGLIGFSSNMLNFQTNYNSVEVDMSKFFPTLTRDKLNESWLFSITNQLLELPEEKQKIVFKLLDFASGYYYNLFDILNSKYKPFSEYRQKCSEIMFPDQSGPFLLRTDAGEYNLWKANLSESDYEIIPNEVMELLLKNTSIKPTDNSRFKGKRIEEFFEQLGTKTSVLISNSDLEEMIQQWDSSQRGISRCYSMHDPIDLENLNLQSFAQQITEYVVEGWVEGVDLSETMLTALNTDSFDLFKESMSKIQAGFEDSGDERYTALFYFRLDDENVDIKLYCLKQLLIEQEYINTENLDILFTSKIISIGKDYSGNLEIIRDVSQFLNDLNDKYSNLLELYLDIYYTQFRHEYYDLITQTHFYPLRNNIYGDVEGCTEENLCRDLNRITSRKIELEEKIISEWNAFMLPEIINNVYSDRESKILAIQIAKEFSSPEVEVFLSKMQRSNDPEIQFWAGKRNQTGLSKNNIDEIWNW